MAKLYDISCLLGTPEFATVQDEWFALEPYQQQVGCLPLNVLCSDEPHTGPPSVPRPHDPPRIRPLLHRELFGHGYQPEVRVGLGWRQVVHHRGKGVWDTCS